MPFLYMLAIVLGLSVCMQSTVNGQLAGRIGLALTLVINSGVVFVFTSVWYTIERFAGRAPAESSHAPWALYLGGPFGVLILTCAAVAYPKLGAGTTTTIAVASQVVTALALDQFGATGRHVPFSLQRALGVALVVAGVWLVVASASKPA